MLVLQAQPVRFMPFYHNSETEKQMKDLPGLPDNSWPLKQSFSHPEQEIGEKAVFEWEENS